MRLTQNQTGVKRSSLGWIASSAAVMAIVSLAHASNCVLVVEGSDPDIDIDNKLEAFSERSAAQYAAKGYTVIRARTKDAVLAGLNNPCVTRMVYTGHGRYDENDNPLAAWWIGPGTAPDDYLSAAEIISAIPAPRRSAIVGVQMNSCGQLQSGWGSAFPSASIYGWATEVTFWSVRWDQYFNQAGRIPPKGGRSDERGGPGLFPTAYDVRNAEGIELTPNGTPGVRIARNWTELPTFGYTIAEPARTLFGTKRFNLFIGDSEFDQLIVGGFEVSGGVMTSESDMIHPAPDFVLRFTNAGFDAANFNQDSLPSLLMAGDAMIGENISGVPDHVLYAGAVAVLFGFDIAVPPVGCVGDADGSGAVNFADITSVLANFGASGPAFGPGDADGSGTVNFADITTVLANFGVPCP